MHHATSNTDLFSIPRTFREAVAQNDWRELHMERPYGLGRFLSSLLPSRFFQN